MAIREMYRAFQNTNPLPKDPNLIDYGFNIENEEALLMEDCCEMHALQFQEQEEQALKEQ